MAKASGCAWSRQVLFLLSGAVLGSAVAGGFFLYRWLGDPHYTATALFQVTGPAMPVGGIDPRTPVDPPDLAARIIHQQVRLFKNEALQHEIVKSDEFQQDKATGKPSMWVQQNRKDIFAALQRDLVVVPHEADEQFELKMTTRDPAESMRLLEAAAKVYKDFLQGESIARKSYNLKNLADAVKIAESAFNIKSSELEDFAKRKGIDVLQARFEIEKTALQSLNSDFMKADAGAAGAEAQYSVMKKSLDAGTEVRLTSDMQQNIENDPILRSLQAQRLNWDQELAAEKSKGNPSLQRITEINARQEELASQIAATRQRLTGDTRVRMIDQYASDATNKRGLANYIGNVRQTKEELVKSLGQDLMQYQRKIDDLKEQQQLLNNLRKEYMLADANRFTDETRIHQVIDIPTIPAEADVPAWWWYFPFGAGGGVAVFALISLGIAARRGRKNLAPGGKIIADPEAPSNGFTVDKSADAGNLSNP